MSHVVYQMQWSCRVFTFAVSELPHRQRAEFIILNFDG